MPFACQTVFQLKLRVTLFGRKPPWVTTVPKQGSPANCYSQLARRQWWKLALNLAQTRKKKKKNNNSTTIRHWPRAVCPTTFIGEEWMWEHTLHLVVALKIGVVHHKAGNWTKDHYTWLGTFDHSYSSKLSSGTGSEESPKLRNVFWLHLNYFDYWYGMYEATKSTF